MSSAKLFAGFVVLGGLAYVSFTAQERSGSVGATRWQRWFNDPSRLTLTEMWPILPMAMLLGVFLLVLSWPWFAVLVAPTVVLTRRYARRHESPSSNLKRGGATSSAE